MDCDNFMSSHGFERDKEAAVSSDFDANNKRKQTVYLSNTFERDDLFKSLLNDVQK